MILRNVLVTPDRGLIFRVWVVPLGLVGRMRLAKIHPRIANPMQKMDENNAMVDMTDAEVEAQMDEWHTYHNG